MSNAATLADVIGQIDRLKMQLAAIDPELPTGAALRTGRATAYLAYARAEIDQAARFPVDPIIDPIPEHDTDVTTTANERFL